MICAWPGRMFALEPGPMEQDPHYTPRVLRQEKRFAFRRAVALPPPRSCNERYGMNLPG